MLEPLLKKSKGYGFLSSLQLARIQQDDFLVSFSNMPLQKLQTIYEKIIQKIGNDSALKNFLGISLDFLTMNVGKENTKVRSLMENFFTPGNPWHIIGFENIALWSYLKQDDKKIQEYFLKWLQKTPDGSSWVPESAARGAVISIFSGEKDK
jgi:hypothetical protein